MSTKLVFDSIRNIKLTSKLDKDGHPASVIAFSTYADPHNLAELIDMVSQRPITITITSPQFGFGDVTTGGKEDSQ